MATSTILRHTYPNGEIQKFEIVEGFSWSDLTFISPPTSTKVVKEMARLYKTNMISKYPERFGTLVFCHIPSSVTSLPFNRNTDIGYIWDNQVLANYYFDKMVANNTVTYTNGKLIFTNPTINQFFSTLQKKGYVAIERGENSSMTYICISELMGFLSDINTSNFLINSHFFLMDITDRDSPYDVFGTSYGLALEIGKILQPPLLHRKSLLVDKEGKVSITLMEIEDLAVTIDERTYRDRHRCKFYYRPESRKTPITQGSDIIIVNQKVVAVKHGGNSLIPMGGFIIQSDERVYIQSALVTYQELPEYQFGIQVGPAMTANDTMIATLDCPFYTGEGTPFPSTVYPLPFESAKAARMGIGNRGDKPVIIWAEGAGKLSYQPKVESSGASLLEFAQFVQSLGISNFVNIDGGGSAQIIQNGMRKLKISDRYKESNEEAERPIPLGLRIIGE